jgi:hypothetical protein
MKRKGAVLNRRAYRAGHKALRWAKTGMNWADGPDRDSLMADARLLLEFPILVETIGRECLKPGFGWTQSWVTAAVRGDQAWLAELRGEAGE